MTRGEKISLLMTKKKANVKELADYIGMSDKNLYRILNDKVKNPAPEALHKMAEFFDCTIEDIIVNDIDEEKIYFDEESIFKHLPRDLQEFVAKEESTPYLTVAKMLEGYNLDKITPFQMGILIDWLRDAVNKKQ